MIRPSALGALILLLLVVSVIVRVQLLRRRGIAAMKFGATDRSDFLIPPFALLYFYLVFSGAFDWPAPQARAFASESIAWIGVGLCAIGLGLMVASLVSFGTSFRVGIDAQAPDKLVTTGIYAFTRNPIYVAFACVLLGEFLIQPLWILLIYLVAGFALFHRQVLREETFLRAHYGQAFETYARSVHRYI